MTDHITAMKQALEALETALPLMKPINFRDWGGPRAAAYEQHGRAITSLRAALAQQQAPQKERPDFIAGYDSGLADGHRDWGKFRDQQQQGEPVAYLKEFGVCGRRVDLHPECEPWLAVMEPTITPLYTAPPAQSAATVQQGEPLFLLHTGQIDSDGEQDDWDIEADSGKRVAEFCRTNPGQTIGLYPAPAAAPSADLIEAVDTLLEQALCDCPDKMRHDRGEHLSGCHLFDLNLARAAMLAARPAHVPEAGCGNIPAAAKREPLTDEQIAAAMTGYGPTGIEFGALRRVARAIERAHGIGGEA